MKKMRYVRDDFDKDEFARLVIAAKGKNRTMQQFAADIGTKPSTLSRIINKKNATASSDRLLIAIAQNADPESNVTLEMLRKANGLKCSKEISMALESEFARMVYSTLERRFEEDPAVNIKERGIETVITKHYRCDFLFDTNLYGRWAFEIKAPFTPTGYGSWYQKLMMLVGILLTSDDIDKISFVFPRKELHEQMKRLLDELNIDKEISSILIQDNEIVEEYCTGHKYGLERSDA